MNFKNIQILILYILPFLLLNLYQSQVIETVTIFQEEIGVYQDPDDNLYYDCREGCVDCLNDSVCTSCENGWFLFHTPQNTIECVKCPYYESYSGGANEDAELTFNRINKCASCIEMPVQWEYIRTCTFRYSFASDDQSFTPQNTTLNKPELFTIVVDLETQQNTATTRYSTQQLIENCDTYTWKNYYVDTLATEEQIDENLQGFNTFKCGGCQQGSLYNTDDDSCDLCSDAITQCTQCFLNPKTNQASCTACGTGYGPNTEQSACVSCAASIDNCTDCYSDTHSGELVCSTCATGYRTSENGQCIQFNCTDENCTSCIEDDSVCDQCVDRYKLDGDSCVVAKECQFYLTTQECTDCYTAVDATPPYNGGTINCLFCGKDYETDQYSCMEPCKSGFGYSEITETCVSCSAIENCSSCFIAGNGNIECESCASGYGMDREQNICFPCGGENGVEGCIDCDRFPGPVQGQYEFQCYECKSGFGIVYPEDPEEGYTCKPCQDCTECSYTKTQSGTFYQQCTACSESVKSPQPVGLEILCRDSCSENFGGKCTTGQCFDNDYYGLHDIDITIYPTQLIRCNKCVEGYSLNSVGDSCTQNISYCRNSVEYPTTISETINPYYTQTSGFCLNGCFEPGLSLSNTQQFFYDPLLKKCVICESNLTKCRNKIQVDRYVYCDETLSTKPYSDINDDNYQYIGVIDMERYFNFEFNFGEGGDAELWEKIGVSTVELNVIFVAGTTRESKKCRINPGTAEVTTNIPDNIFKLTDVQINWQTWQYSTENDQRYIRNNADMSFIIFSEKSDAEFLDINLKGLSVNITRVSKFTMAKLNFKTPEANDVEDQEEDRITYTELKFKLKDSLPDSQFIMSDITLSNTSNFHLIPKFEFEDLGTLGITNFEYSSVSNGSRLTGFQLFEFTKYRNYNFNFNINVEGFVLEDFFIKDSIIFEIPERKANVNIKDVTLNNIVFKNSFFLGDTSSGFDNGEQWLVVKNLTVQECLFYDSSFIYIRNSNYFLAQNWVFQGIEVSIQDNDFQSLIDTNVYLFDGVDFENIQLYKSNLIEQTTSPSAIDYYYDYNKIDDVTINNVQVYLDTSKRIINLSGASHIYLKAFSIIQVKYIEVGTTLKYDVSSYVVDQSLSVYGVKAYSVIYIQETEGPEYITSIRTNTPVYELIIDAFQGSQLDDMNFLELQNMNNVSIYDFLCGTNDEDYTYKAYCLKAYTTATSAMGTFILQKAAIINMKNTHITPMSIDGYITIQLDNLVVYDVELQSGIMLKPWGESATVTISNSKFINMKTTLELNAIVNSGALYIDNTTPTSTTVNLTDCEFKLVYSKYQAGALYIENPQAQIEINLTNVDFTHVIAMKGAAFYGEFVDQSRNRMNIENVTYTGNEDNEEIVIEVTVYSPFTGDEDTVIAQGTLTAPGNIQFFDEHVKKFGQDTTEVTYTDDSNIFQSEKHLSIFFIGKATVSVNNFTIQNIRGQQGFVLVEGYLIATQLQLLNIKCIGCSNYLGSNTLQNSFFNIQQSTFTSNYSKSGGGLYITGMPNGFDQALSTISDTTFENNWADYRGGGLYISDTFFSLDTVQFIGNNAQGNYQEGNNLRGEGGGLFTEIDTSLDNGTFQTTERRRRVLAGTNGMKMQNCVFKNNIAQFGAAGRITGDLPTVSGSTYTNNQASLGDNDLVETCIYGEGIASDGKCQTCPANQYSLDKVGQSCKQCPDGATCLGGDRLIIKAGFWRPNNYSDSVIACSNNEANCLQSTEYSNFTCADGYLGALCEACDLHAKHTSDGAKYSVTTVYNCGRCDDQATNGIKVAGMNIWVLISMLLAVKGTLQLVQDKIRLRALWVLFPGFKQKDDETGILIKMFTNYAQIIVILSTLEISLPNALTDVQDIFGNPVKSLGNALDCYLVEMQEEIPNIYFKIMWQIVMNLMQFAAFLLIFAVLKLKKKTRLPFYYLFYTTMIYLLIYLQPSYVTQILQTISCREVGGYDYILADVSYQCWTDEYNVWSYVFLVPFLLFWIVVLPGIMIFILVRHANNGTLQSADTLYKFGFLYQEYKDSIYYWELVKVLEKTLIVVVIQYYSNDIKEKAILVFEIVFIYAIFTYYKQPFNNKHLNDLDITSSIVCCISLITGVFIWNIPDKYWYFKYSGLVAIFLINAWFVIIMIYKILGKVRSDVSKQHGDKLEKAKAKIKVLHKVFKDSPEKQARRKHLWKTLRKYVYLFVDGKQAGYIKSLAPRIPEEDDALSLGEEDMLLSKKVSVVIKDINSIDQSLRQSKDQGVVGSGRNLAEAGSGRSLARKQTTLHVNNPIFQANSPKKRSRKGRNRSIIIPEIDRQRSAMYKSNVKQTLHNSVEVLTGMLTKIQYENLEAKVAQYRRIKEEEFHADKERFKEYFIRFLDEHKDLGVKTNHESQRQMIGSGDGIKINQVIPIVQAESKEGSEGKLSVVNEMESVGGKNKETDTKNNDLNTPRSIDKLVQEEEGNQTGTHKRVKSNQRRKENPESLFNMKDDEKENLSNNNLNQQQKEEVKRDEEGEDSEQLHTFKGEESPKDSQFKQ